MKKIIDFFEIPISRNYIDNWEIPQAIREIYANAVDGARAKTKAGIKFVQNVVTITNFSDEKLTPSSLVLGGTSKSHADTHIGQFGEGYKLALIVLLREECEVEIYNKDELWVPRFGHSKKYGTEVLQISVYDNPIKDMTLTNQQIMFVLKGIALVDYEEFTNLLIPARIAKQKPLVKTEAFEIYDTREYIDNLTNEDGKKWDEIHRNRGIYVGGIRIQSATIPAIVTVHPDKAKLSRDRDHLSNAEILNNVKAEFYRAQKEPLTDTQIRDIVLKEDKDTINDKLFNRLKQAFKEYHKIIGDGQVHLIESKEKLKQANALGIELPINTIVRTLETRDLLEFFDMPYKDFESRILDESLQQIVCDIIAKHKNILAKPEAAQLYQELNLLKDIAPSFWRG